MSERFARADLLLRAAVNITFYRSFGALNTHISHTGIRSAHHLLARPMYRFVRSAAADGPLHVHNSPDVRFTTASLPSAVSMYRMTVCECISLKRKKRKSKTTILCIYSVSSLNNVPLNISIS